MSLLCMFFVARKCRHSIFIRRNNHVRGVGLFASEQAHAWHLPGRGGR